MSDVIRTGQPLIRTILVAETEPETDRRSDTFFTAKVTPARTNQWAEVHGIRLPPISV